MRTQAVGRNLRALTAFALALLSSRLLGAEAKTLIGVDLRIEAPNFRSNLSRNIDNVQKELSRLVAVLSADRHEFLTWQALKDVRDLSQLSAILHVSVTQEADGVMLRFSPEAGRAGTHFECLEGAVRPLSFVSLSDLDRQLFSPLEPQPGDREALAARIRSVLADPKFRDTLGKVFTSQVPICHVAEPIPPNLVAIGLKRSDLDVDDSSTMKLSLCSRLPEARGPQGGELGLDVANRTGIYLDGERKSWIQGRVSSCVFGNFVKDTCVTKIPLMFQKHLDRSLDVLMIDFRPRYPGTLGRQVVRPGAP